MKNMKRTVAKKVSSEKNDGGKLSWRDEVEVREKRSGIVFRVIYVVAIFFAAMINIISKDFGTGLTTTYVIEAYCASFLLCLLIKMILYVFNELKCLSFDNEEERERQFEKTEKSYTKLFLYVHTGGVTILLSFPVVVLFKAIITRNILMATMLVLLCVFIIISFLNRNGNKVWQGFCNVLWSIIVLCPFLMVGIA